MVLPDTSVWVEFSRRAGRAPRPRPGCRPGGGGRDLATRPVAAELLAAAEGELAERLLEMLASLPWAVLDPAAWREVGTAAARLRRDGRTLPLTDLVIAVAAARGGHLLWSFDSDFERIGGVLDELQLYR